MHRAGSSGSDGEFFSDYQKIFTPKVYPNITVRYTHDGGWIAPTPGIVRGVKEAVRLLKLRGHELVHFKPPQLEKGYR